MNASANRVWVMLLKGKEELIAIYYGCDWNLLLEKVDMIKTSENLSFLKCSFFFMI